jgi:hypothetical protein
VTRERGAVADFSPFPGKVPDAMAARQAAKPDAATTPRTRSIAEARYAMLFLLETSCLISGRFAERFGSLQDPSGSRAQASQAQAVILSMSSFSYDLISRIRLFKRAEKR